MIMLCVGGPMHGEEVEHFGVQAEVGRKNEDGSYDVGIYRMAPVVKDNPEAAVDIVAGLWTGWQPKGRAY